VALFTGSTAVLSQALQGFSDVTTAAILFVGVKRARKKADAHHPLGYGREIFFWALLSAIVMFLGTGALSFYFGLQQFLNPEPLENMYIAVLMLSFGLCTNLYAFSKSVQLFKQQSSGKSLWHRIRNSGMVDTKITFMVDLLGSSAAFMGLVSVILYLVTGLASLDGLGAMAVGIATMTGAVVIIIDIHGLIIGRSAPPAIQKKIMRIALSVDGVQTVVDSYVFYIGSNRLFAVLEVHLSDHFTTDQIEKISDEIKAKALKSVPALHRIQIEVETPDHELLSE
jgi:cation diffusion facilitator family transporter